MVIWINGAFGAGKTETCLELNRRIKNSYIYDPENLGEFINNNIPEGIKKEDFQDYSIWRDFNVKMIEKIDKKYKGTIIIPMTIVNKQYFIEIGSKLKDCGIEVRYFTLINSKETLIERLKLRGENEESWAAKQIERCRSSLKDDVFENKIYSDKLTIDQVAREVLGKCNIKII